MSAGNWLFLCLFFIFSSQSYAETLGFIDSVQKGTNGGYTVSGWACRRGGEESVEVLIYASSSSDGSGAQLIQRGLANRANESAVNQACGTQAGSHRYTIELSGIEVRNFNGQNIFARAESSSEPFLSQSGKFQLPRFQFALKGALTFTKVTERGFVLGGWACQTNDPQPMPVKIYLEDSRQPSGRRFYTTVIANQRVSSQASRQCATQGVAHGFTLQVPMQDAVLYQQKKIWAEISSDTHQSTTYELKGSGEYRVQPDFSAGRTRLSAKLGSQHIVIEKTEDVIIDTDIDVQTLTIRGKLICPKDGEFKLNVSNIFVYGIFECGNESARFAGQLKIGFKKEHGAHGGGGHGDAQDHSSHIGTNAFAVFAGGTVRFVANEVTTPYAKLQQTIEAGDNEIVLEDNVHWQIGDEIAIAPTGFDPHETERARIVSVQPISHSAGDRLQLDRKLKFRHYGEIQTYKVGSGQHEKTWTLDERAVVVNLTRNIKIMTAGDPSHHDKIGAHMMVMDGGEAYLDGVEFERMGQMGVMARYPFHWHMAGDVSGQYIKNSSVHDTYQRCITVHGTSYALVNRNVCVDHFGHGYFLEDGDEQFNVITENVGMLSRRISPDRAILASDHSGDENRFSPTSTFWISHPNNKVERNIAAGSEGTGFWMSFINGSVRGSTEPRTANTWSFNGNVAHSTVVGITWDGSAEGASTNNPRNPQDRQMVSAHYSPKEVPIFKDLVVFKNLRAGIYFRGDTAIFENAKMSNNGWSAFFAYNQVVKDSLIVGISENHGQEDFDYVDTFHNSRKEPYGGVIVYDGPFALDGVDFVGFSDQTIIHNGKDYTPIPIKSIGGADRFTNTVEKLRFDPEPVKRVFLHNDRHWYDSDYSMSIRDKDGSLIDLNYDPYVDAHRVSPHAGKVVVHSNRFNEDKSCELRQDWTALICNYNYGLLRVVTDQGNYVPFIAVREDTGVQAITTEQLNHIVENYSLESGIGYNNKIGMILGRGIQYNLQFPYVQHSSGKKSGFIGDTSNTFALIYRSEHLAELSPVIKLSDVGSRCTINGSYRSVNSVREVERSKDTVYYYNKKENSFYLRLKTRHNTGSVKYPKSASKEADFIQLSCS